MVSPGRAQALQRTWNLQQSTKLQPKIKYETYFSIILQKATCPAPPLLILERILSNALQALKPGKVDGFAAKAEIRLGIGGKDAKVPFPYFGLKV
jgi:hypothetical protein